MRVLPRSIKSFRSLHAVEISSERPSILCRQTRCVQAVFPAGPTSAQVEMGNTTRFNNE